MQFNFNFLNSISALSESAWGHFLYVYYYPQNKTKGKLRGTITRVLCFLSYHRLFLLRGNGWTFKDRFMFMKPSYHGNSLHFKKWLLKSTRAYQNNYKNAVKNLLIFFERKQYFMYQWKVCTNVIWHFNSSPCMANTK